MQLSCSGIWECLALHSECQFLGWWWMTQGQSLHLLVFQLWWKRNGMDSRSKERDQGKWKEKMTVLKTTSWLYFYLRPDYVKGTSALSKVVKIKMHDWCSARLGTPPPNCPITKAMFQGMKTHRFRKEYITFVMRLFDRRWKGHFGMLKRWNRNYKVRWVLRRLEVLEGKFRWEMEGVWIWWLCTLKTWINSFI